MNISTQKMESSTKISAGADTIRLLIIGTAPGDRQLVEKVLATDKQAAFCLSIVDRSASLPESIAENNIDAIVLLQSDSLSRDMAFTREIRSATPDLPLIAVSNSHDPHVAKEIMSAGADDYLIKRELTADVLIHCIKVAKRRQGQVSELSSEVVKYKDLIEEINAVIFSADGGGNITYVSPAFESISGFAPTEIVGSLFHKVIYEPDLPMMIDSFRKMMGGELRPDEFRLNIKGGGFRWVRIYSRPFFKNGKFLGVRGVLTDIHEHKSAKGALQEKENLYRSLFENMLEGLAYCKMLYDDAGRPIDWIFLDVNRAFDRLVGLQDVVNKKISEVIPDLQETNPELFEIYGRVALTARPENFEVYIKPLESWLNISVFSPMKEHFVAVFENVTERKRADQELRTSESKYKSLVETIPQKIFAKDKNSVYLSCNALYADDLGIGPEKIVGRNDYNFFPKELADKYRADDKRVMEAGKTEVIEEEYVVEGRRIWVHTEKTPILEKDGSVAGILGIFGDITERKLAELNRQKYLQRQEKLSQLQRALLAPSELSEKLNMITQAVVEIFGADFCRIWCIGPGDLCKSGCAHTESADPEAVICRKDKCLHLMASSGRYSHTDGHAHRRIPFGAHKIGRIASGEQHKFLVNDVVNDPRIHNKDWAHELGLVSFAGYQLRPPGAETVGVLALFSKQAITPEEDAQLDALSSTTGQVIYSAGAEVALRDSEEKFRVIASSAHDAIAMTDQNGDVIFWNNAAERIFGHKQAEVIGRNIHEILAPAQKIESFRSLFNELKAGDPEQNIGKKIELEVKHKNGGIIPVEISLSTMMIKQKRYYVKIIRDISELQKSKAQLIQSEKLAAIGTLAAGVAHEINNPIGYINSNLNTLLKYSCKVKLFLEQLADNDQARGMTEMLKDCGDAITESLEGTSRVKKIVTDLKSFSRLDKTEKEYADLNAGLESTLNIVWNELKYRCKVEKELGELPEVYCIPNQLNQVFMNLLINAGQAISHDHGLIKIKSWADEQNVYVSVKDNGCGILAENVNKIFEAFFTTKELGKGTGLGLSLAFDIIKKHGGTIDVQSTVGEGTEFIICLPRGGDASK